MKEKIDYSLVPNYYSLCLNSECSTADTCLRQLAAQVVPANIERFTIISPKYLTTLKADCPHYRAIATIRFAKGFISILDNLPHKQTTTVAAHLMSYFGRRNYYRFRKGERLLSPFEQQQVLNILQNCGISQPLEFDAYVEKYEW